MCVCGGGGQIEGTSSKHQKHTSKEEGSIYRAPKLNPKIILRGVESISHRVPQLSSRIALMGGRRDSVP